MSDPIRAIVRTFTSERDRNGNVYHYCMIYDVRQGVYKTINVETGGPDNGGSMVGRILGDRGCSTVLCTEETIPKRLWQAKRHNLTCHYEHEAESVLRAFFGVKS
jgi:hypothetical protein